MMDVHRRTIPAVNETPVGMGRRDDKVPFPKVRHACSDLVDVESILDTVLDGVPIVARRYVETKPHARIVLQQFPDVAQVVHHHGATTYEEYVAVGFVTGPYSRAQSVSGIDEVSSGLSK
jgi:hypothetical protein